MKLLFQFCIGNCDLFILFTKGLLQSSYGSFLFKACLLHLLVISCKLVMFNLQGLQIIPVLPIELVQIVVFLLQPIYLLCSLLNSSNSQTNFVGEKSSYLKVTVQIFSDQVCCSRHPQQVQRKSQNFALLNITWA
jgi:hypothetical protein